MIDSGTVQNGLKLMFWTWVDITGEWRSGLPITVLWRDSTTPLLTASSSVAGMFIMT